MSESRSPCFTGKGQNLTKRTDCTLCNGDGWLLVRERPAVNTIWMEDHGITEVPKDKGGMSEAAPCPMCNPDSPGYAVPFWRGKLWSYTDTPGVIQIAGVQ